jgi:hypothetical protein
MTAKKVTEEQFRCTMDTKRKFQEGKESEKKKVKKEQYENSRTSHKKTMKKRLLRPPDEAPQEDTMTTMIIRLKGKASLSMRKK